MGITYPQQKSCKASWDTVSSSPSKTWSCFLFYLTYLQKSGNYYFHRRREPTWIVERVDDICVDGLLVRMLEEVVAGRFQDPCTLPGPGVSRGLRRSWRLERGR